MLNTIKHQDLAGLIPVIKMYQFVVVEKEDSIIVSHPSTKHSVEVRHIFDFINWCIVENTLLN
jgi:hypothetical protein